MIVKYNYKKVTDLFYIYFNQIMKNIKNALHFATRKSCSTLATTLFFHFLKNNNNQKVFSYKQELESH